MLLYSSFHQVLCLFHLQGIILFLKSIYYTISIKQNRFYMVIVIQNLDLHLYNQNGSGIFYDLRTINDICATFRDEVT